MEALPTGPNDRRRLLASVESAIGGSIEAALTAHGFRRTRRPAAFHRAREGVESAVRLGLSSRPPSLGRVGILIEPSLWVAVPDWTAEARRRLAGQNWPTEHVDGPLVFELLDWLVPGSRPHWTLSDQPSTSEIGSLGARLDAAIAEIGLPFLNRFATPADVLRHVESGGRPLDDARFTLICGAIMEGRSDLARTFLNGLGTARRVALERLLESTTSRDIPAR
jgi:hypothetical protein